MLCSSSSTRRMALRCASSDINRVFCSWFLIECVPELPRYTVYNDIATRRWVASSARSPRNGPNYSNSSDGHKKQPTAFPSQGQGLSAAAITRKIVRGFFSKNARHDSGLRQAATPFHLLPFYPSFPRSISPYFPHLCMKRASGNTGKGAFYFRRRRTMLMDARAASMLLGGRTVPFVMMPRACP